MPKTKIQWNPGDPASMMQSGKRMPVLVLGYAPASEDDERGEERKVTVRHADGTQHDVHPNALLAPGQTRQYRQRKARVENGGVAAEANRLARDGFRLVHILDMEVKTSRSEDGAGKLATLLFEREVPAEIEKVEIAGPVPTPPAPSREEPTFGGDDERERDEPTGEVEDDEPEPGHEDGDESEEEPEEEEESEDDETGDEPEDRDRPVRGAGGRFQKRS